MRNTRHLLSVRIIAGLLVLLFIMPHGTVYATNNTAIPRASDYLDSYNTYIYNAALGKVRIYFHVSSADYMDDIGVLSIQLFESVDNENWTRVKTYTHDTTSDMLGHNEIYHSSYVTYSGTIGRYYKAYVCIWAGEDGNGDTRYMWTNIQKATLFAG